MEDSLPNTEKILIIGWKAGDSFILEKLKTVKNPINLTVVSGTKNGTKEVARVIKKYVEVKKEVVFEGFSNFIGSDECNEFFK
ncbi:MAG: hypothetical protein Q8Q95_00725 [bacterium]|nr:hypothetical protein [bacterium]